MQNIRSLSLMVRKLKCLLKMKIDIQMKAGKQGDMNVNPCSMFLIALSLPNTMKNAMWTR